MLCLLDHYFIIGNLFLFVYATKVVHFLILTKNISIKVKPLSIKYSLKTISGFFPTSHGINKS